MASKRMRKQPTTFSHNLRKYRKASGIRLKDMARLVGIAGCTYNAYETGSREPALFILKRISQVLSISIDELLENYIDPCSYPWTAGGSDTARYKAIGNGMAQPCADFIMRQIARYGRGKDKG